MTKNKLTYDQACFSVLVYEFLDDEKTIKESEKKIKRKLRYYKLDAYDQTRVDLIRRFKNDLSNEISKYKKSKYYLGAKGEYCAMEDYNTKKMIIDYSAKYSTIDKKDIVSFLSFAIYIYYLR